MRVIKRQQSWLYSPPTQAPVHLENYWAGCTLGLNSSGWLGCAGTATPTTGVVVPESIGGIGDIVPEGGFGILRSSGDPGTMLAGKLGMCMRFATLL